jgi:hypothetical protein
MKLRIAALAALLVAGSATSALAATATANVSATLVNPGSVSATQDLAFGTIVKPTSGANTITVASSAGSLTPSVSGGGNATPQGTGNATAATFHLVGIPSGTYSLTSTALNFTNNDGSLTSTGIETPTVASGSFTAGTGAGTLPAAGTTDMFIGGHFTIGTGATVQTYNGTLQVVVTFN